MFLAADVLSYHNDLAEAERLSTQNENTADGAPNSTAHTFGKSSPAWPRQRDTWFMRKTLNSIKRGNVNINHRATSPAWHDVVFVATEQARSALRLRRRPAR